jgi:hypothetical protein
MHLTSNDVGTFLFPPVTYDSVDSYVKFWMTAPISDGVLSNITLAYDELIRRQWLSASVTWGHIYDNAHARELHNGTEKSKAEALAARNVAYNAAVEEWHVTRPKRIKADYARAVARAGQLSYYRTAFAETDQELINRFTISVGDQDMTVLEVVLSYQLGEIRPDFHDLASTSAERLEDIRTELRRMQQIR